MASNRSRWAVLALALAFPHGVHGQLCGLWQAGAAPGVRSTISSYTYESSAPGLVDAAAVWDPDGHGPLPQWLVISGPFEVAGNVHADDWAAFDGQEWIPFTNRPPVPGHAHLLANIEGRLIAGVGQSLFEFDGRWRHLGRVEPAMPGPTIFRCAALIDGQLWIGGNFSSIDAVPANGLAAWDGSAWRTVDHGLPSRATVQSILEHDGAVLTGGYVAQSSNWDIDAFVRERRDQVWRDLGVWNGAGTSTVNVLFAHGGDLLAGGAFGGLQGPTGGAIRRWDGTTWTSTHSGLVDPVGAITADAAGLTAYSTGNRGDLVNRKSNRAIAYRYNGSTWSLLGTGSRADVRGVVEFQGRTIAFGEFTGGVNHGLAWHDGEMWQGVGGGLGHYVRAFGAWNGRLLAAGNGISVREDGQWRPLPGPVLPGTVTAIASVQDRLFAAVSEYAVYEWRGDSWARLSGVYGVAHPGWVSPSIFGLTGYDGKLYVYGRFRGEKNGLGAGIVAWNGQAWESLDNGVAEASEVTAAMVHHDRLVVAGAFKSAGNIVVSNIAEWDGARWSAMGAGIPTRVIDLEIHEGELHALAWPEVGNTGWLWRWTGSQWVRAGDTSYVTWTPTKLRSIRGELVIFAAGGPWVLQGTQWLDMSREGLWPAWTMVEHEGRVFAALRQGTYLWGRVASFVAEQQGAAVSLITAPASDVVTVREGERATLSVTIGGSGRPRARWSYDDLSLVHNQSWDGSLIQLGVNPPYHTTGRAAAVYLSIPSARRAHAGGYSVAVSDDCGNSARASVSLKVLCGGDFNENGVVSWTDIADYLDAWLRRDERASLDGYYGCTTSDLMLFLSFYFAGCE